jgi:hypothetical protein
METPTVNSPLVARRVSLAIAGLLLALVMYCGMAAATAPKASATGFCVNATLAPYGAYGDRCYAWEWEAHPKLAIVGIATNERAGCATSAAGNSYDLKEPWFCAGNYAFVSRYVDKTTEPRRGVIRNNNLSFSARFSGSMTCCWS